MTILVTGGAGFIGSRVTRKLLERGEKVVCLDLAPDAARFGQYPERESLKIVRGDVTRFDDVVNAFACNKIDRVIHVAALVTTDIEADPRLGIRVNIDGTSNVFEACRYFGCKRVVYASSIAVYGDQSEHGDVEIDEDNLLRPSTLYGYSKQLNEIMA